MYVIYIQLKRFFEMSESSAFRSPHGSFQPNFFAMKQFFPREIYILQCKLALDAIEKRLKYCLPNLFVVVKFNGIE